MIQEKPERRRTLKEISVIKIERKDQHERERERGTNISISIKRS